MPESARHINELLDSARDHDTAVAEQAARAQYAGEADPYKKKDEED